MSEKDKITFRELARKQKSSIYEMRDRLFPELKKAEPEPETPKEKYITESELIEILAALTEPEAAEGSENNAEE